MDSMSAFAMGEANRHQRIRVFDWDEAARSIKASGAKNASAGLQGDWKYTGGEIYRDGKIVPREDTYVYLASCWATPELAMDWTEDCWRYADETDGWDSGTYWPESARKILESVDAEVLEIE